MDDVGSSRWQAKQSRQRYKYFAPDGAKNWASATLPAFNAWRKAIVKKAFRILVHLCRFGLAALFLFTAGAKLWILKQFAGKVAELLSSMGWNYHRWQWPVTIFVIAAEIVIALFLIVPRTIRVGAVLAALLTIGFSAFALYYVYVLHGEPLECGCFGNIIGSQLGLKTALRNLGLLIPAAIVFFGEKRSSSPTMREGASA